MNNLMGELAAARVNELLAEAERQRTASLFRSLRRTRRAQHPDSNRRRPAWRALAQR